MSTLKDKTGRYGSLKYKALKTLEARSSAGLNTPMRTWCIISGLGYRSLARHAPRWVRFNYVKRSICDVFGYGDYEYSIAPAGIAWLEYAEANLPMAEQFLEEWRSYFAMITPRMAELHALSFKEFVKTMRELSCSVS